MLIFFLFPIKGFYLSVNHMLIKKKKDFSFFFVHIKSKKNCPFGQFFLFMFPLLSSYGISILELNSPFVVFSFTIYTPVLTFLIGI